MAGAVVAIMASAASAILMQRRHARTNVDKFANDVWLPTLKGQSRLGCLSELRDAEAFQFLQLHRLLLSCARSTPKWATRVKSIARLRKVVEACRFVRASSSASSKRSRPTGRARIGTTDKTHSCSRGHQLSDSMARSCGRPPVHCPTRRTRNADRCKGVFHARAIGRSFQLVV